MSVVAAYHVFVCTLFPVQGGMWTALKINLIHGWLTDTFNCTIHVMSDRRMVCKW